MLLVERFPLMLRALQSALESVDGLTVVGTADSAPKAMELYYRLRPGLVITDWTLDEPGDGGRLSRNLKNQPDPPRVLLYSSSNQLDVLAACLNGAADSFVYRKADAKQLLEAITETRRGVPTWYLGGHVRDPTRQIVPGSDAGAVAGQLTARESQVLELLLRRYSNAEIADELYLAHQTVKNYVSTILQKLDVSSRRELLSSRQR
ncbi:response regulator transcription factor [Actinocrinis puniceicyclus]|uniref:Response regulator transcription factor n=1 Tax=Actinocrinis puniceicyclus TaxID=977794 RepID=A0A8J7WQA6_9ACTN|nr:response regulator transcription factor [Actinocrinis puniceicyclus]MBS2964392.1 response regulator transcription factor [Actinocrinis puniceicyclus]